MGDLEIVKACAEAMGFETLTYAGMVYIAMNARGQAGSKYDPLHDDAQCLALVKKLELRLQEPETQPSADRRWRVTCWTPLKTVAQNVDLNRAVCECVANMKRGAK